MLNYGWTKQSKCIFDSNRRFEFRRNRDIRVRDIEIRLYLFVPDSRHPPSKDDLSHICNNIGRHWRKLGFALGFSRGTVDGIEADFNLEGTYEMAWQTLLKWRRQYGDQARLCDLAHALNDIGQTELAMELPV